MVILRAGLLCPERERCRIGVGHMYVVIIRNRKGLRSNRASWVLLCWSWCKEDVVLGRFAGRGAAIGIGSSLPVAGVPEGCDVRRVD